MPAKASVTGPGRTIMPGRRHRANNQSGHTMPARAAECCRLTGRPRPRRALFILLALYFLGGETLSDFALALLIGIVVGTYSSVFTAAPLAVVIEGSDAPAADEEPRVLAPSGGPSKPLAQEAPSDAVDEQEVVPVGQPAPVGSRPSRPQAPRPRKKKRTSRR